MFFSSRPKGTALRAEAAGERGIDRKAGIGIENFVAGLDEGHHGERESHLAAGRDEDFFAGNFQAASALQICGDGVRKSGDAASGNVAVAAGGDGVAQGVDDRGGGMKIGLAKFEVNDGAAFALEFLGAGKNREGAFAGQLRNASCKRTHRFGKFREEYYHFTAATGRRNWRDGDAQAVDEARKHFEGSGGEE